MPEPFLPPDMRIAEEISEAVPYTDVPEAEYVSRSSGDYLSAFLYLLALAGTELLVALINPLWGVIIDGLLLIGLVMHSSFAGNGAMQKFYLALALAPLVRILSLSIPLVEFPQVYWYAIVAVPLLVAAFAVMVKLKLSARQVGFNLNSLVLQLFVGLTGFLFGATEYYILQPQPMVDVFDWRVILIPAVILFIGTGFTEEFVFRGLMQNTANRALGGWGVIYIVMLFTVFHIGYLSIPDLGLVFVVGLFFGLVVQKTGSILGVTIAHGITNIMLYLIAPFIF